MRLYSSDGETAEGPASQQTSTTDHQPEGLRARAWEPPKVLWPNGYPPRRQPRPSLQADCTPNRFFISKQKPSPHQKALSLKAFISSLHAASPCRGATNKAWPMKRNQEEHDGHQSSPLDVQDTSDDLVDNHLGHEGVEQLKPRWPASCNCRPWRLPPVRKRLRRIWHQELELNSAAFSGFMTCIGTMLSGLRRCAKVGEMCSLSHMVVLLEPVSVPLCQNGYGTAGKLGNQGKLTPWTRGPSHEEEGGSAPTATGRARVNVPEL